MMTDMENAGNKRESEAQAREFGSVLSLASEPPVPADAVSRLMTRIAAEPQDSPQADIIAFAPRVAARRPSILRYAAALPLAASLALGVYLGAYGKLDFMLPAAITGVALNDDAPDDLGGVGEADAYADESLT